MPTGSQGIEIDRAANLSGHGNPKVLIKLAFRICQLRVFERAFINPNQLDGVVCEDVRPRGYIADGDDAYAMDPGPTEARVHAIMR